MYFTIVIFLLILVSDVKYGSSTTVYPLVAVSLITCYSESLQTPTYVQWITFPAIVAWKRSYEIIRTSGGNHDFIVWETGLLTNEAIQRMHTIYRVARSLTFITCSKLGVLLAIVDYVRYLQL